MNSLMKLEYEMFLNGYSIKQISELVDTPYLFVKFNINRMQRKINNEKLLVSRVLNFN